MYHVLSNRKRREFKLKNQWADNLNDPDAYEVYEGPTALALSDIVAICPDKVQADRIARALKHLDSIDYEDI